MRFITLLQGKGIYPEGVSALWQLISEPRLYVFPKDIHLALLKGKLDKTVS